MKTLKPFLLTLVLLVSLQASAQVSSLRTSINKVTENYLNVKTALAANDGDAAADKAKGLLAALNEVPPKRMTADQEKLWTKYFGQLIFDTRHISEVPRVHHQQAHFVRLTTNLHTILTGFKMNHAGI